MVRKYCCHLLAQPLQEQCGRSHAPNGIAVGVVVATQHHMLGTLHQLPELGALLVGEHTLQRYGFSHIFLPLMRYTPGRVIFCSRRPVRS